MPGILQGDANSRSRLAAAVAAEFMGTFLFALIGGAVPAKNHQTAVCNGLALMVMIYATANISGGHLNPAVTAATLITGHTAMSRALAYMVAQVAGATLASAMHMLLVPKAAGIGCFGPGGGATLGQAFGWEVLTTMMLVMAVYSGCVGQPNFGVAGPATVGLTLLACALAAGPLSGAALNPARVLGPALVFGGCGSWAGTFTYVFAQLVGAVAAAGFSAPIYGAGPHLGRWMDAVEHAVDDAKEALRGTYRRLEGAAEDA